QPRGVGDSGPRAGSLRNRDRRRVRGRPRAPVRNGERAARRRRAPSRERRSERVSGSIGSDLARLKENVALAYRGDRAGIDLVLTALLSRVHILIEDVPGVGKTTLARALGRSLSLVVRRTQVASDAVPADLAGIWRFDAAT